MASNVINMLGEMTCDVNEEAGADCLIEMQDIRLSQVALYHAQRVDDAHSWTVSSLAGSTRRPIAFMKHTTNVLEKRHDVAVQMVRNLDGYTSKRVPDTFVYVHLAMIECRLPVEAYATLKGFLEMNLGEDLGPPPELPLANIIAAHLPQSYKTFQFCLDLSNVVLHCRAPAVSSIDVDAYVGRAPDDERAAEARLFTLDMTSARLSFDSSADGATELDFICHVVQLIDRRFDEAAVNKRGNVHATMLRAKHEIERNAPSNNDTNFVMAELHVLSVRDAPQKQTILLDKCRGIVLVDWWLRVQQFIGVWHHYPRTAIEQGRVL